MTLPAASGYVAIQGQQWDTTPGGGSIGPFSIPCSTFSQIIPIAAGSSNFQVGIQGATGAVPVGVLFVPNAALSGATISIGPVSPPAMRISPLYPTLISLDPLAFPQNIWVTISAVAGGILSAQIF